MSTASQDSGVYIGRTFLDAPASVLGRPSSIMPSRSESESTASADSLRSAASCAINADARNPIVLQAGLELVLQHGTRVQLVDKLGGGAFGVVWRVSRINQDGRASETLALKVAQCDSVAECIDTHATFENEIRMLQMCHGYPRVVQMIDYLNCVSQCNPECRWMILLELADSNLTEYMARRLDAAVEPGSIVLPGLPQVQYSGEVVSMLRRASGVSKTMSYGFAATDCSLIREIIRGCAEALQQFRAAAKKRGLKVVHGDIKFDNFLVRNGVIMLADFGLAVAYPDDTAGLELQPIRGSPGFVDPTYVMTGYITDKADEYALGCMLWYMAFDGFVPGHNKLVDGKTIYERASDLVRFTNASSVANAIAMLTQFDPESRMTAASLLTSDVCAAFLPYRLETDGKVIVPQPQLIRLIPSSSGSTTLSRIGTPRLQSAVLTLPANAYYQVIEFDGSVAYALNNFAAATRADSVESGRAIPKQATPILNDIAAESFRMERAGEIHTSSM